VPASRRRLFRRPTRGPVCAWCRLPRTQSVARITCSSSASTASLLLSPARISRISIRPARRRLRDKRDPPRRARLLARPPRLPAHRARRSLLLSFAVGALRLLVALWAKCESAAVFLSTARMVWPCRSTDRARSPFVFRRDGGRLRLLPRGFRRAPIPNDHFQQAGRGATREPLDAAPCPRAQSSPMLHSRSCLSPRRGASSWSLPLSFSHPHPGARRRPGPPARSMWPETIIQRPQAARVFRTPAVKTCGAAGR